KDAKDRVVCFCYNVPESVIVEAIRGGCQSLMDIRRETYASTGCAGCSEEVKKLLRKHVNAAPDSEGSDSGDAGNGKLNHG
ncbi:MAG: (2Fe-2S)-binding protein, partial [Bdellovibrionota bacterium]